MFHPIVPDKSTGPPPLQPPREAMLLAELIWEIEIKNNGVRNIAFIHYRTTFMIQEQGADNL